MPKGKPKNAEIFGDLVSTMWPASLLWQMVTTIKPRIKGSSFLLHSGYCGPTARTIGSTILDKVFDVEHLKAQEEYAQCSIVVFFSWLVDWLGVRLVSSVGWWVDWLVVNPVGNNVMVTRAVDCWATDTSVFVVGIAIAKKILSAQKQLNCIPEWYGMSWVSGLMTISIFFKFFQNQISQGSFALVLIQVPWTHGVRKYSHHCAPLVLLWD